MAHGTVLLSISLSLSVLFFYWFAFADSRSFRYLGFEGLSGDLHPALSFYTEHDTIVIDWDAPCPASMLTSEVVTGQKKS
jgi:hypothetical protein